MTKSFAKNIGANLTTLDGTGGFQFGIGSGRHHHVAIQRVGRPPRDRLDRVTVYPADLGHRSVRGLHSGHRNHAGQPAHHARRPAGRLFGLDVLGALDLGETNGQVVTLAQPNLSALSGETASFLAGGEIPIPLSTGPRRGVGRVQAIWRQPGLHADGAVGRPHLLRVRPEVSRTDGRGLGHGRRHGDPRR